MKLDVTPYRKAFKNYLENKSYFVDLVKALHEIDNADLNNDLSIGEISLDLVLLEEKSGVVYDVFKDKILSYLYDRKGSYHRLDIFKIVWRGFLEKWLWNSSHVCPNSYFFDNFSHLENSCEYVSSTLDALDHELGKDIEDYFSGEFLDFLRSHPVIRLLLIGWYGVAHGNISIRNICNQNLESLVEDGYILSKTLNNSDLYRITPKGIDLLLDENH